MRTGDPAAPPIGERTLKIEAARAGVTPEKYLARLRQGVLYCYRCRDWHDAGAFPADSRRHSGRAGSCRDAICAAAMEELAGRSQLPSPAAVWVVKRPGPAAEPGSGEAWAYWHRPRQRGRPGPDRTGTWSPSLDQDVARFPAASDARDALITAFGGADAVPPGCRLARLE